MTRLKPTQSEEPAAIDSETAAGTFSGIHSVRHLGISETQTKRRSDRRDGAVQSIKTDDNNGNNHQLSLTHPASNIAAKAADAEDVDDDAVKSGCLHCTQMPPLSTDTRPRSQVCGTVQCRLCD